MSDDIEITAYDDRLSRLLFKSIDVSLKCSIPSLNSVIDSFEIPNSRMGRINTDHYEMRKYLGYKTTLNVKIFVLVAGTEPFDNCLVAVVTIFFIIATFFVLRLFFNTLSIGGHELLIQ